MGLFPGFQKKEGGAIALFDIASGSVAGAYAVLEPKETISVVWSKRIAIPDTKTAAVGLVRALDSLVLDMTTQGGPLLRAKQGNTHISATHVVLGAPWQKTSITSKVVDKDKPFVITPALFAEVPASKETKTTKNTIKTDTLVATMLNGYEVEHPFGKTASRAEFVVLSSEIEHEVNEAIIRALRQFNAPATPKPFVVLGHELVHALFPKQEEYLTMRVAEHDTAIAVVKKGSVVSIASIPHGIEDIGKTVRAHGISSNDGPHTLIDPARNANLDSALKDIEKTWCEALVKSLEACAGEYALPRTLFLFAGETSRSFFTRLLSRDELRALWLSDEPLRIVTVRPDQFKNHLVPPERTPLDTLLALAAINVQNTPLS